MTLLGNFVRTSGQGEQIISWRSMNDMNSIRSSLRAISCLMRMLILTSHASFAPFVPYERMMSFLSGHLYEISQQSHTWTCDYNVLLSGSFSYSYRCQWISC